ncbi:DUF389 domain-containing protein [Candidatus Roizmanbacteria bacterium]|nr:MAG: DUF389 domain-containing protein [Candidatus Roizmanbacteria bacterium]
MASDEDFSWDISCPTKIHYSVAYSSFGFCCHQSGEFVSDYSCFSAESGKSEILTRTQPTLLDIVIALSAGTVAAFAIVQKRISSSLAGVAIATSLMPPLCVGGIGLALLNPKIASGGLLLFIANVVSIIFVSIFVFRIVGIETHGSQKLQKTGLSLLLLCWLLRRYRCFSFSKLLI